MIQWFRMIGFLDFSHHLVRQPMHNALKADLFLSSGRRVGRNLLGWKHSYHWLISTLSTGPNQIVTSLIFHLSRDTASEILRSVQNTQHLMKSRKPVIVCVRYFSAGRQTIRQLILNVSEIGTLTMDATHYTPNTQSKEIASNLVIHISQMCLFQFCLLH
jgi:hypothetical protein